jgi:hypothetical protein
VLFLPTLQSPRLQPHLAYKSHRRRVVAVCAGCARSVFMPLEAASSGQGLGDSAAVRAWR